MRIEEKTEVFVKEAEFDAKWKAEQEENKRISRETRKRRRDEWKERTGWVDGRKNRERHEYKLISILKSDADWFDHRRVTGYTKPLSYANCISELIRNSEIIDRQTVCSDWISFGKQRYDSRSDEDALIKLIEVLTDRLRTIRTKERMVQERWAQHKEEILKELE
jgi:hypothetical protein